MLFDVIWCYMMLYDVIWCYMMLYDVSRCYMMLYDVVWCCMMLYDVVWCYMMLYDVIWCYIDVIWCYIDVIWCYNDVIWCYMMLYWCYIDVIWCYNDVICWQHSTTGTSLLPAWRYQLTSMIQQVPISGSNFSWFITNPRYQNALNLNQIHIKSLVQSPYFHIYIYFHMVFLRLQFWASGFRAPGFTDPRNSILG